MGNNFLRKIMNGWFFKDLNIDSLTGQLCDCYCYSYWYYSTLCEFFTPTLAGGLSLESERQQVSSDLQDSYEYPCRSLKFCGLEGLDSSSYSLPSQLRLQNTPTASLQRGKTLSTSVLDMTLNNQMVSIQYCWSFGECWVPFYCHRSQARSGST